ncbi:Cell wall assembly regulator SMI1 [Streptomyces zhaozhouensis]|uniref:Cell wall assembly regulator SMI1 n=1 Tax=Streptomyces zhaozhouensis TaxID=1300267 RepID=A0A286DSS2_9ACTN|nr:SMI1/KNR4 family protein [Streptomyces zhaozhouensis]SOD61604.1 Cell wall assembly regulator SMI1 [Streptomyces zhaozhouensis]
MTSYSKGQPFLHVRDEDFSLPDRGDEQVGPGSAAPAGDPDEAVRLFRVSRRLTAELTGSEDELPGPAGEEEIAALEDELGVALPPDLRALYGIADGEGFELAHPGVFCGWSWIGLSEAGALDDEWLDIKREWEYAPWGTPVRDADPPGAVRRSPLRDGWVRFADDTGGNWLAVDMDPGPNGRPGQVIAVGIDFAEGPLYVADSVTTLLRRLVEALERGDHQGPGDGAGITVDLPNFRTADTTYVARRPSPAEAEEAGGALMRAARVSDVEDCAFLAALPEVREVTLHSDGSPDLTPLGDHPLEHLRLDVASADLTALARNAELRLLSLACSDPVDLRPLRTLPRLWALDLASATVADLAVVAELKELRFLEVTAEQWRELRERDDLPALALLGVHPEPPEEKVPALVDWTVVEDEPPWEDEG